MYKLFLPAILLAFSSGAMAADLPNRSITPGAADPRVTQENIHETICRPYVKGQLSWSKQNRPPLEYTNRLKMAQIQQYGYADTDPRHYEQDHLEPISVGGSPTDPKNEWPEPRTTVTQWGAEKKDALEWAMYKAVCNGDISLADAQSAFSTNWIKAYQQYENTLISKYPNPYQAGE